MKKLIYCFLIIIIVSLVLASCDINIGKSQSSYTVTFTVDGDIYHTLQTEGKEKIVLPPDPTNKDGFVFNGWYTDSGEKLTAESFLENHLQSDIAVFARWVLEQTYTLTFEANGGYLYQKELTAHGGADIQEPSRPDFDGYIFDGWYRNADLSGERFEFGIMPSENVILYAKWLMNNDLLKFSLINDGTEYEVSRDDYAKNSKGIVIPATFSDLPVTRIAKDAFFSMPELAYVVIPDTVTEIGKWAFANCYKLSEISIPKSVKLIEQGAFSGCRIKKLEVDLESWVTADIKSNPIDPHSDFTVLYQNGKPVEELVIPNGVTTIGKGTFAELKTITSLIIPDSVNTISEYAFSDCIKLENVSIAMGVTKIENYAFKNCSSLNAFTIPTSVVDIGKEMLIGCLSLTEITFPHWEPDNISINGYQPTVRYLTGSDIAEKISKVTINGGEKIGNTSFSNCKALENIFIPSSITAIGRRAFENCTSLKALTIPESITHISELAFNGSGLTNISLPNALETIESKAFSNCQGLTSMAIPDNIKNIGAEILHKCENITSLTLPFLGATEDATENVHLKYLFDNDSPYRVPVSLEKVTLTNITVLADNAFSSCHEIEEVVLPEGLLRIGENAFYSCSRLKVINIPTSLTTIETRAFYNCYTLKSITISSGVKYIGKNAFNLCKELKNVTFENTADWYVVSDSGEGAITVTNTGVNAMNLRENLSERIWENRTI